MRVVLATVGTRGDVQHGGSGTTAAALRAGVAQVVLPMMLDQLHHAHHLARAGLAPRAPSMARVGPRTLARAIEHALALPPEPRRAMAGRLARIDAGAAIVDRLERMTSGARSSAGDRLDPAT